MMRWIAFLIVIVAWLGNAVAQTTPLTTQPTTQPAPRVLIISVDGLRPDLLLRADAPQMNSLWKTGSFSFWAKTTAASITLPSHVSMLTGVVPEVHAIMWNGDLPLSKPVYPSSTTIFQLAKKAGYSTAMAAGKSKFIVLAVPDSIDYQYITSSSKSDDDDVTQKALVFLKSFKPDLMFVHFPGPDNAGHAKGWGSDEQMAAIAKTDVCIGQILSALDDMDLRKSTTIILSADHGGQGRTHGPDDTRSRTIPWIINGPGIRKNFDLTLLGREVDITTYDTFPTVCSILGINPDKRLDGKVVAQAFEKDELMVSTYEPKMQPATKPAVP